jgi:serine/threonine protein kinase
MTSTSEAVHNLSGTVLQNGWRVLNLIVPSSCATGGSFSCGYVVESPTGEQAFLKAFDFSQAMESADPAVTLNAMTSAFIFERELLRRCHQKQLKRIVTVMGGGQVRVPTAPGGVIYYLIFERADADVRIKIDTERRFDVAWRLRTLHHIASAIRQLHGVKIAHQDVKPSNILFYSQHGSKLTDLGRAACEGLNPPHEGEAIAGDPDYAPPELLYGFTGDWHTRRFGCDLYLLGSMIVYFFTNQGITHLWMKNLEPTLRPSSYQGPYSAIVAHVRDAFGTALDEFRTHIHQIDIRDELSTFVRQLCDPDPYHRGHPAERGRGGNPFSLERYISRFNHLATRIELGLYGKG